MEAVVAFGASLLTLRLAGALIQRWRERRRPELAFWAVGLAAFALASGALAWGAAAGWDDRAFRVYYLFGGLVTAPLLGAGSLLLIGRRLAAPLGLFYAGLAVGVAVSEPVKGSVTGTEIPAAQDHFDFFPARLLALLGNTLGTLALVAVALLTLRRRPFGNTLVLAGVILAAVGTALAGLGTAGTAVFVAAAAVLLYGGFTVR